MTDLSTDRLEPAARGTPVATSNEPHDANPPASRRRKSPKQDSSENDPNRLERAEERVRQIDQMA